MNARLVLIAAALALAGCGAPQSFTQADEENFTSSCVASGGAGGACACVWDKIEANLSPSEVAAAEAAQKLGQSHPVQERVLGYARECHDAAQ